MSKLIEYDETARRIWRSAWTSWPTPCSDAGAARPACGAGQGVSWRDPRLPTTASRWHVRSSWKIRLKTWAPTGEVGGRKTNDVAGDGTTATILAQA